MRQSTHAHIHTKYTHSKRTYAPPKTLSQVPRLSRVETESVSSTVKPSLLRRAGEYAGKRYTVPDTGVVSMEEQACWW